MRVYVHGAAGRVGSATVAAMITNRTGAELVLFDTQVDRLAVQIMDFQLMAVMDRTCRIRPGQWEHAATADLIIMASGVPHRDGAARAEFLTANRRILEELLDTLPFDWPGLLIIATNPVDPLCAVASTRLQQASVLGYSRNDSLRLSQAIGTELGCPGHHVEAWALGEHGPLLVPLFDRTKVNGEHIDLTVGQQARALRRTLGWYDRWQALGTGLTSAWTTGTGVADLARRFAGTTTSLTTASIMSHGQYGLDGVCLGLPVKIGGGRVELLEWPLLPDQHAQLQIAAQAVAEAISTSQG